MDIELINKTVELIDERNYLRNLLEIAEEMETNVENIIYFKLGNIQDELNLLEKEK